MNSRLKSLAVPSLAMALLLITSAIVTAPQARSEIHHPYLDFDVFPLLSVDYSSKQKIIDLTPSSSQNGNSCSEDVCVSGYRVIQAKELEIGAGIAGTLHFENVAASIEPAGAFVGVMPIGGKKVLTDRWVQSLGDVKKLPPIHVPYDAADVDGWRTGDNMTFQTSGGIAFLGGAGYFAAGVAGAAVAKGEWTTYVEKKDDRTVYVKITNTKLGSLDVLVGALPANVGVGAFRGIDDSFGFDFDLSNPSGAAAYEDTLKGHVASAQEMARASQGVTWDFTSHGRRTGRLTRWWLGVPYVLNMSGDSQKIHSFVHTEYHQDNRRTDVQYGIYLREKRSHIFWKNSDRTQGFYGADELESGDETISESQFGKYLFEYENDHASEKTVNEAIDTLEKLTGIHETAQTGIPSGKLGYLDVKLTLAFAQESTNALMALNDLGAIQDRARRLVDGYFSQGDRLGMCDDRNLQDNPGDCRDSYLRDAYKGIKDAGKALEKMRASLSKDPGKFAIAYGELGKAMMTNRFSFQAILGSLTTAPTVEFVIQGEKVPLLDIVSDTVVNRAPNR